MLFKHPLILPSVAVLVSLVACAWYGYQWSATTHWNQATLSDSVHLNVTVEQAGPVHGNAGKIGASASQSLPQRMRARLIHHLNDNWRTSRRYFFLALMLSVFSIAMLIYRMTLLRRSAARARGITPEGKD